MILTHRSLAHTTLSGYPGQWSSQSGTQARWFMFLAMNPWVARIAHKPLTPGHPARSPPPHWRGHLPKRFMSMCLFLFSCYRNILIIILQGGINLDTTMRPEMITQMICKQMFGVKDVRAIGKWTPREFLCVISVRRKYHLEAPELHTQ